MPADDTTDREGGASPSPTERTGGVIFSLDLTEETEDSGSDALAEGFHAGNKVGGILKEANGGDAGGPGREAGGRVFCGDSTNGQDRNFDGRADLRKTSETLRRSIPGFRRRRKDGAEENIAGASGGGRLGSFERVARDT